jgi:hypothetical protein
LARLFLEIRKRFTKGQNSGKVSWILVPVRAVPVARKTKHNLITASKPEVFFQERDFRNRNQNSEEPVLSTSPGQDVFCILDTEHDRTILSGECVAESKVTELKTVLGSSVDEDIFRDNNSPL